MSSSEVSNYLSTVKWGEEGHYLKEFTSKLKLPQAAKIIKGQYQSLGVPTLPSPHLSQVVLLASAGIKLKVVAQCVKFKDAGRRMVLVGSKLSIPENYDGWFEILSEDGRAVRCIESVVELARRSPSKCLLRESLKVNLPKTDDAESVGDKTRTLSAGEVLTVGELVSGNARNNRSGTGKYLSCTTGFGEAVFLPMEARCRFSSVAGEENISGVHSVRTLMAKRFPLMVRLVHGKPPAGLKAGSQFVHEMRLYSLIEDESLVAMPLTPKADSGGVVPLPSNAPLKVLAPKNADVLLKTPEHAALVGRCSSLMSEVSGCIQTCDVSSVREIRNPDLYQRHLDRDRLRSVPLVRRSASDPQGTAGSGRVAQHHLERGMSTPNGKAATDKKQATDDGGSDDSETLRYDEIDQIYDYVRGFAPLPPNIRNEFSASDEHGKSHQLLPQINCNNNSGSGCSKPPEPPPIETIPVRKSGTGTVKQQASPHKVTVSIVNRTPSLKTKEILLPHRSSRTKKAVDDHIYEKIGRRKNPGALKLAEFFESQGRNGPLRSNSASKIFNNVICDSNNNNSSSSKLPYRRTSQYQLHVNHGRSRFLKNTRNSYSKDPLLSANNNNSNRNRWANSGGVKTIATSPLFHIRYKSLTDLLMDTKKSSPESSNTSSGRKNVDGGGSAGSSSTLSSKNDNDNDPTPPDDGFSDLDVQNGPKNVSRSRRLSRPKSLSNLVGGLVDPKRRVDNHNYYNLVQNDLIKPPPPVELGCHKFYSMPDSTRFAAKNHYSSNHAKKLGTLYL